MLKSFAAWVLMAAAVLEAEPLPANVLPTHMDVEPRDPDGHGVEPRAVATVNVVATFEDRTAPVGGRTPLGVYKGLNFQGMGMDPAPARPGRSG